MGNKTMTLRIVALLIAAVSACNACRRTPPLFSEVHNPDQPFLGNGRRAKAVGRSEPRGPGNFGLKYSFLWEDELGKRVSVLEITKSLERYLKRTAAWREYELAPIKHPTHQTVESKWTKYIVCLEPVAVVALRERRCYYRHVFLSEAAVPSPEPARTDEPADDHSRYFVASSTFPYAYDYATVLPWAEEVLFFSPEAGVSPTLIRPGPEEVLLLELEQGKRLVLQQDPRGDLLVLVKGGHRAATERPPD